MNETESGFTLMETLLSVAIILIISSLFVVYGSTATGGVSRAIRAVRTAAELARIDRYIRDRTDRLHIPYWADPSPYIAGLKGELYRSNIGPSIRSIRTIINNRNVPRGIEVAYTVNNREMQTAALLPSIAILDKDR